MNDKRIHPMQWAAARDRLHGGPEFPAWDAATMTVEAGPRGFFVAIGRGADRFRVSPFYAQRFRARQERDTKAAEYRAAGWQIDE